MEGLLFAVKPIWWEGKITLLQVCIFVIVCLFIVIVHSLFYTYIIQKKKKNEGTNLPIFNLINPRENNFELKTLTELKKLIWYYYAPNHSDAHTVSEIGKYLFDSQLIETAQKLEVAIYKNEKLSEDERNIINISIQRFLDASKLKFK